jgi:putative oxidoreductase
MEHPIKNSEQGMDALFDKYAISTLRLALALIYIWFGSLKIFGVSPIEGLVAKVTPILPKDVSVPLIGVMEVAIGLGLLFRVALRRTLILFGFQIASTFLPVFLSPKDVFQKGNPLLLTETGEFILKNLVLLAAGVAVGSTVREKGETLDAVTE